MTDCNVRVALAAASENGTDSTVAGNDVDRVLDAYCNVYVSPYVCACALVQFVKRLCEYVVNGGSVRMVRVPTAHENEALMLVKRRACKAHRTSSRYKRAYRMRALCLIRLKARLV